MKLHIHMLAGACILAAGLGLLGCSGGDEASLEAFRRQWHAAINSGRPQELFALLDTASRRRVEHDLEQLRGLDRDIQQQVIDQLGGVAVDSLADLSAEQYFALLWEKITRGQRPTSVIEANGDDSASLLLRLGDRPPQRIMLMIEGGRWAWRLPPQQFEADPPTDPELS